MKPFFTKARPALAVVTLATGLAALAAQSVDAAPQAKPLLKSAISLDAAAETITLPLHEGKTASGAPTWYVVIDSSSRTDATKRGVNYAPALAKALGTKAVEKAHLDRGTVVFPGTVNFAPKRVVVPSAEGFPRRRSPPARSETSSTAR